MGGGERINAQPVVEAAPLQTRGAEIQSLVSEEAREVVIPRGIADATSGRVYVVASDEHVLVLDLGTGEILARSATPATPLALVSGGFVGWSTDPERPHGIDIFAFRVADAALEPLWKTGIELPEWVEPTSNEAQAFELKASVSGDEVSLEWTARSSYRGGAAPPQRVEQAAIRNRRGHLRLDLETGAVVSRREEEAPGVAVEELPVLESDRRIVPYRSGSDYATAAWQMGSTETFLAARIDEPGMMLVRRSEDGAKETPLSTDPGAEANLTPDRKLLFVNELGRPGDWRVFSTSTGEEITTLPFDEGTESVATVDDSVLYLVTETVGGKRLRSLRCRDLRSGSRLWSQPLGEEEIEQAPPLPR